MKQIHAQDLDRIRKAQHSDLHARRIFQHNIRMPSHQLPCQETRVRLEDDSTRWIGRIFKRKSRDREESWILDGGREGDNIVGCRCGQQKNGRCRTWQSHMETDQRRKRFHRTWVAGTNIPFHLYNSR